jgi:hypothetical protein
MQLNYWDGIHHRRVSRRRALIGGASTVGAAAFLAACGGGDADKTPKTRSELVEESKDTTSQAVRGGTLRGYLPSDVPSLDPVQPASSRFVAGYHRDASNESPAIWGRPRPSCTVTWRKAGRNHRTGFRSRSS